MKRYPNIFTLESLHRLNREAAVGLKDGRWVPARPLGFPSVGQRLRAAAMVFQGRADAVIWPGGQ